MDIRAIAMGLTFAVIWSSAFSSARLIVADASPLAALSLRFFISGFIAIGIARLMGQHWNLSAQQWRATIVFGLCQNTIYLGANFYAMQTVQASLASIIASSMPLLVALAGWVFLKQRLAPMGVIGLFGGLVGVLIIMVSRVDAGVDLFGVVLCGLGAASLAAATLTLRNAFQGENMMMIIGLQMIVGALGLTAISAALETVTVTVTPSLILAFAYTTIFPGLIAMWIWFALVARIGTTRAATFHFLNPFFGVAIAAALLGEQLGWRDLLGVAVITAGIVAVQLSKQTET
ncbi:MAG: DMT family transporter [Rhodobacteraceae bacterium]|nr:DMT family transporter [Paracoccaceae bacterium]